MARIRVNTEDLKTKAKEFESAAETCDKAGDDILSAAMEMPSCEGQLSGPARAAGYEIQRQCRELRSLLEGDAQSLKETALAFEEVDNRTIERLGESISTIMNSPLTERSATAGIRSDMPCDSYEEPQIPICKRKQFWEWEGLHFGGEGWTYANLETIILGLDKILLTIGDLSKMKTALGMDRRSGLTILGGEVTDTNAIYIHAKNTIVLE
jgi:uncharacterized protein YukE